LKAHDVGTAYKVSSQSVLVYQSLKAAVVGTALTWTRKKPKEQLPKKKKPRSHDLRHHHNDNAQAMLVMVPLRKRQTKLHTDASLHFGSIYV